MMTEKLYGGIDLHSNNSMVVLLNESDKVVYQKRFRNDLEEILKALSPYQEQLQAIAVESTYNWYWQVDGLQAVGFKVHLANTSFLQQYSGLKHTDDKKDAVWLAHLLRLGLLEEGYIYPKEQRGVRELLRRRMLLVRQQTMNLLSIQGLMTRYENIKLTAEKMKQGLADEEKLKKLLHHLRDDHVRLAVESQLTVSAVLAEQIHLLEQRLLTEVKKDKNFYRLQSVPGIGPILAMTILLETGDIKRFASVGNYSSYCRCVESKRISNGKKKGENNRKNGNRYLGWAFIEASYHAIRHYEVITRYYQKKAAKTQEIVARKTVAHKLSRASYFILRDGVEFDMKKAFG